MTGPESSVFCCSKYFVTGKRQSLTDDLDWHAPLQSSWHSQRYVSHQHCSTGWIEVSMFFRMSPSCQTILPVPDAGAGWLCLNSTPHCTAVFHAFSAQLCRKLTLAPRAWWLQNRSILGHFYMNFFPSPLLLFYTHIENCDALSASSAFLYQRESINWIFMCELCSLYILS